MLIAKCAFSVYNGRIACYRLFNVKGITVFPLFYLNQITHSTNTNGPESQIKCNIHFYFDNYIYNSFFGYFIYVKSYRQERR